ncbi:hypothetical protein HDU91_006318, partial [Kappamyces sp. JEL0680]
LGKSCWNESPRHRPEESTTPLVPAHSLDLHPTRSGEGIRRATRTLILPTMPETETTTEAISEGAITGKATADGTEIATTEARSLTVDSRRTGSSGIQGILAATRTVAS